MSKKNSEKYLPLRWIDVFAEQLNSVYREPINFEDIRILCEQHYSPSEKREIFKKYPMITERLALLSMTDNNFSHEHLRDLDSISMAMIWAKNKQVYALDNDFIDELLNTETLTFSKDAWDYLPYEYFYVDLSANEKVCENILGNGMLIKVEKTVDKNKGESAYICHICKLSDKYFFTDVFSFENRNYEVPVAEILENNQVPIWEATKDGNYPEQRTETFNAVMYKTLIPQILSYLASVEPDMQENEDTKRTYRKPAANSQPKNKFSEIRKWDIGVRYGTAFRRWKKQKSDNVISSASGNGTKQRPHSRRAHWSHYWYGHGEDKVRRPKWVSAYFVNIQNGDDSSTIIHKVNNIEK